MSEKRRFLNEQEGKVQVNIRPDQIKVEKSGAIYGTFDKHEVELCAGRLVKFFQYQGRWCEFTLAQLTEFYRHNGWKGEGVALLFGLVGFWFDDGALGCVREDRQYLLFFPEGEIMVSTDFVERCAKRQLETA